MVSILEVFLMSDPFHEKDDDGWIFAITASFDLYDVYSYGRFWGLDLSFLFYLFIAKCYLYSN